MNDKIKRIDEFKDIDEFKTIQDLLDKYMDGATSNEEEATLRKYFEEHGNDIPEEWEPIFLPIRPFFMFIPPLVIGWVSPT